MTDMFKLWYLGENDMLREGNSYRLCDTGQGLNRVQQAPQVGDSLLWCLIVSKMMCGCISRCVLVSQD
jgi:hypothetical protein